jgi:hypothetical protein
VKASAGTLTSWLLTSGALFGGTDSVGGAAGDGAVVAREAPGGVEKMMRVWHPVPLGSIRRAKLIPVPSRRLKTASTGVRFWSETETS